MEQDFNRWADEKGPVFFKKLGIKKDQKILDFGCGWGSNSLAVARLVAPSGYVYALEKEKDSIFKLLEAAKARNIGNIKVVEASEDIVIPAGDCEFDGALLYDVVHDYYFDRKERKKLFAEMHRIIREEGLLSVYPHHIDGGGIDTIMQEIKEAGFTFRDELDDTVLHDSTLIQDSVYNFTRD